MHRTSALEHMHQQLPIRPERRLYAKRGRGSFIAGASGPAKEGQPLKPLCADLQPPDLLWARLIKPSDERTASIGLE